MSLWISQPHSKLPQSRHLVKTHNQQKKLDSCNSTVTSLSYAVIGSETNEVRWDGFSHKLKLKWAGQFQIICSDQVKLYLH
jgi:hypothetical protein